MRTVLLALGATLAFTACGDTEPPPAATPEVVEPEKPAEVVKPAEPAPFDAAAAFGTTCATCHGAEGKGDGVAGAALDPKPANFADAAFWEGRDDASIANVIKNGGVSVGKSPLMAPFGSQFDDEQITALVEHMKTFKAAE